MIIKIKNIAIQFLLQSILTAALTGILVFIFLLSSGKKESITHSVKLVDFLSFSINQLADFPDKVLTLEKTQADFVAISSEVALKDYSKSINQLIDTINILRNFDYLKASLNKSRSCDTIVLLLRQIEQHSKLLVLSLKEKGNINGGYTGNSFETYQNLLKVLATAPDKGESAGELFEIGNQYFSNLEANARSELYTFCDNLSFKLSAFPNYDLSEIDRLVSEITNSLEHIEVVDERLFGSSDFTGQINEYNNLSAKLTASFISFQSGIWNRILHYYRNWNVAIILLSIVLIGFIIYMLQVISRRLRHSIQKVDTACSGLLAGDIESPVDTTAYYEIGKVTQKLDSLKNQLIDRKEFIVELLSDNYNREIELLSKKDIIGQQLNALREKLHQVKLEQEARDKDNEIKRYINEGLARFSDIMRVNSNNTTALGDNLIKELVKYLRALQGTLFLIEETNIQELHLISAFAYDRKKFLNKKLRLGEGLIGTCALERKTINLREVPSDYIIIRSGLGDTPPNNLLIVPVIHEEDLVGVIELASLNEFKPHEIDLSEQICSNLASTIITVRNNTKTAILLEKSQQQAAEMAEQEEEMRQNMEELKATQEESARREEEMQGILDAIGTSFYVVEYTSDGSITHLNEMLVKFLGQPYESVIGQKHTDIFTDESKLDDAFFREINQSKQPVKLTETLSLGSKEITYTHSISPIVSKYNEVIKILNLMTIEVK